MVKLHIVPRVSEASALAAREPDLAGAATHLATESQAANTRRAYECSWRLFSEWCEGKNVRAVGASPEIVALYLTDLLSEGNAPVSLSRAYSGIADRLRIRDPATWAPGHRPEAVRRVLAGAYRTAGRPSEGKKPLLGSHFVTLARLPAETLRQKRDRALLMLAFAGAFRRSELVALDREDLELTDEGLRVMVGRSKTDQKGEGFVKAIARASDKSVCVIAALGEWIRGARIKEGPLFRRIFYPSETLGGRLSDKHVADVVKRAAKKLRLDPSKYAGHSARSGFVTTAALQGADVDSIMRQTGHTNVEQVRRYIRVQTPFQKNAATGMLDKAAAEAERKRR